MGQIASRAALRSEEHTSELQSLRHLVCRLLLEKTKSCAMPTIMVGSICPLPVMLSSVWQNGSSCIFFKDTATTEIYTLSLHDALPISCKSAYDNPPASLTIPLVARDFQSDRKSTRLNSSHLGISYAVFCLKKQKR